MMTNAEIIRRLIESGLCQDTVLLAAAVRASNIPGLSDRVPDFPKKFYPEEGRREIAMATMFVGGNIALRDAEDGDRLELFVAFLDEIEL
jgi:hypothetical protein